MNLKSPSRLLAIALITLSFSACNSEDQSATPVAPLSAAITNGGTSVTTTPTPVATTTPRPTATPAPTATPRPTATPVATATPTPTATPVTTGSYPSCVSSDTTHICIGLKIVSYESNGVPVLTEADAVTLVNGINTVWSQCNIGFQLEDFEIVDPTTLGLPYSPNWSTQTNAVREQFATKTQFLVAAVGPWNVSTIAVTMMPGSGVYGTIVDQQYSHNPLTVGHELGHYQGLYHISDDTNLMTPYISTTAKILTTSQCTTARATDPADWSAMMRKP